MQWATCTKRSHDQIKQLGKNEAQKRKKHIKISYTANCQLLILNTTKMTMKWKWWNFLRFVGGVVKRITQHVFSERFLRKNGIFKKLLFLFPFVLKLGLFINYNMIFPFLDLIFTILDDLGEMRWHDLLVEVAYYVLFTQCLKKVSCWSTHSSL